MGITKNDSKFLFYTRQLGVSYETTLTLGRQLLYVKKDEIASHISYFKNAAQQLNEVQFIDGYCEPLFQILGAKITDSMDFSAYEKATVIHDLNCPIGSELKNKYTAVIDSGTLEHIFDFKTSVKNCMEMVAPSGHFIGISPCNNLMGHGFYQFTPELFYSVFSSSNGFEMQKMIIAACDERGNFFDWYEVANPALIKERLHMVNSFPTYLMFVAKKIKDVPVFNVAPQQSDYVTTWSEHAPVSDGETKVNKTKSAWRKFMPKFIRDFLYRFRKSLKKKEVSPSLGKIDPRQFKKMDV